MSETKIEARSAADDVFIVPESIYKCLPTVTVQQLRVFLYICRNRSYTVAEAIKYLQITEEEFESAVKLAAELQIFNFDISEEKQQETEKPEEKKKSALPSLIQNYDAETVAQAYENVKAFKSIADIAASCIGKSELNRNDLNSLYNLYDYCGLDMHFLCGVIEYCCSAGKKSMQYIMKTALGMADLGINTYEKLEEYLAIKTVAQDSASKLRKLCGFGQRSLSSKEEKYIVRWFEEMRYGFEMVKLAYEITVDKTHEVSFNYMGKILENWFARGYKTPSDIEKGAKNSHKSTPSGESFNVDDFVAAALKKGIS